jgi:hypothetical protein
MNQAPNRDGIVKEVVKEALEEINPAADKKAACEKEIRTCLSVLDDLRALKEESLSWPSPAEKKADMDRLAKTLKKAETILLLPTYQRIGASSGDTSRSAFRWWHTGKNAVRHSLRPVNRRRKGKAGPCRSRSRR